MMVVTVSREEHPNESQEDDGLLYDSTGKCGERDGSCPGNLENLWKYGPTVSTFPHRNVDRNANCNDDDDEEARIATQMKKSRVATNRKKTLVATTNVEKSPSFLLRHVRFLVEQLFAWRLVAATGCVLARESTSPLHPSPTRSRRRKPTLLETLVATPFLLRANVGHVRVAPR
jgi:hypothetical protein